MKRRKHSRKLLEVIISIGFVMLMVIADPQATNAQWSTNGNNVYKTNTAGNVGIGTTNPTQKLEVSGGPIKITGGDIYIDNNQTIRAGGGNQSLIYRSSSNGIFLGSGDVNDFLVFNAGGSEKVRIATSGNIGIGTTNPGYLLDARGTIAVTDTNANTIARIRGIGSSGSQRGALELYDTNVLKTAIYSDGNDSFIYSGKLGIGTTSPAAQLHVTGSGNGIYAAQFVNTYSSGAGYGVYIKGGNNASDWALAVRNTGDADLLRIRGDGNVGIGTPSPGYKLDVNGNTNVTGNITASGTIYAKYQDVAEWVPSSEQLAAGTVVVLDSTKSNQVISSTRSYDTRVAGVVSEKPGLALGEKSESKVLVATTGRVIVKVDATKSPIQIGDLLVTSDIPGVAMKSEAVNLGSVQIHRPGTLIGKALEPLAKGKGEILVLLSLQ